MKWNADAVAFAVATDIFHWRKYVVVPNVSWGLLPHEADMIAMTDAGYLSEVEIKVSKADFLADREKYKHKLAESRGPHELIKEFYYAMPTTVWEKCKPDDLPTGAGLILCGQRNEWGNDIKARVAQKATPNLGARKMRDDERHQLMRLGYMRYWCRQESVERLLSSVLRDAESRSAASDGTANRA